MGHGLGVVPMAGLAGDAANNTERLDGIDGLYMPMPLSLVLAF